MQGAFETDPVPNDGDLANLGEAAWPGKIENLHFLLD
jgi:hypothetical protein